jgi:hypothetical protein
MIFCKSRIIVEVLFYIQFFWLASTPEVLYWGVCVYFFQSIYVLSSTSCNCPLDTVKVPKGSTNGDSLPRGGLVLQFLNVFCLLSDIF